MQRFQTYMNLRYVSIRAIMDNLTAIYRHSCVTKMTGRIKLKFCIILLHIREPGKPIHVPQTRLGSTASAIIIVVIFLRELFYICYKLRYFL